MKSIFLLLLPAIVLCSCHTQKQEDESAHAVTLKGDVIHIGSESPVLSKLTKEMVKPGTHINAVGTFIPTTREVSSDLVAAARLYSDQTEAAKRESGEYLIPLKEGLIKEDHIVGSIGEVLLGKAPGRTADDEITIFDALGLAIEDVASAKYVYERAAL